MFDVSENHVSFCVSFLHMLSVDIDLISSLCASGFLRLAGVTSQGGDNLAFLLAHDIKVI